MIIDAGLVSKVARLASLELSENERDQMSRQLTRIVEHFEALRQVEAEELGSDELAPPSPYREDVPVGRQMGGEVQKNAPEFSHGHFVVPRIVSRGE
ncbi:MAG: Asp-tRNA(Asn)/Glu-tRNA(Gln) amidotransferase subunit GatC [Acidobacteria bacterium]|nr:Asp-tRNA(Asn)/Glu-tRNA(Gln) amidotransferase subunit GatC [Acidobacteriota bacterium]